MGKLGALGLFCFVITCDPLFEKRGLNIIVAQRYIEIVGRGSWSQIKFGMTIIRWDDKGMLRWQVCGGMIK